MMETYKKLLEELNQSGNLRCLPLIEPQGKWIIRDGRRMLNLSSNDYLGLSRDTRLRKEFLTRAMEKYLPLSSASSRLLTGNFPVYTELEELLASSYGKESALVFNSGYHANVGILPALADKDTLILADKLVHASLIDGIRLSGAAYKRFRHQDYEQAEHILQNSAHTYKRIILVTESIFSMDGDIADLQRLVRIKKQYPNALLYVDEAHAIGVRGKRGLGIAEESGTLRDIDLAAPSGTSTCWWVPSGRHSPRWAPLWCVAGFSMMCWSIGCARSSSARHSPLYKWPGPVISSGSCPGWRTGARI